MGFRFIRLILSVILLSFFSPQTILGQYKWAVFGRVVDTCGKPVAFARVLVFPPEPIGGWKTHDLIISEEKANIEGKFRYERESPLLVDSESILYITSPLPPEALILGNLTPPFSALRRIDRSFSGRSIHFKSNEEMNVGDVPVQVSFGVVIVYLQNEKGKPMFTDTEDWKYVGLRVLDLQGRRVEDSYLSPANVSKAVRVKESALTLALPEGAWRIEIAPDGEKGKWLTTEMLLIKASNSPLKVTLKPTSKRKKI